jgi:cell division protein FtsQ
MTTLQKTPRANFVRHRRTSKTRPAQSQKRTEQTARRSYHPTPVILPVETMSVARQSIRQVQGSTSSRAIRNSHRNGYDIAFSLGRTKVRAPVLNIPQLGPRWVSAGLTLLLCFMLYAMWTASPFMVSAAEIRGNLRLGAAEINSVLGILSQPVFKVIPAQISANLQTAFPDMESVNVRVGLPNRIIVDVVERKPVLAWYQDGAVTWIDSSGVAFTPRGEVPGLVQVAANAAPPTISPDPTLPPYRQKFIPTEMVQALVALDSDVPVGMPMIFDPQYGMGWQDPRGWTVYFGQTAEGIQMKMDVYNAIVDSLTLQGIQPSLISVEYLDAPFYK